MASKSNSFITKQKVFIFVVVGVLVLLAAIGVGAYFSDTQITDDDNVIPVVQPKISSSGTVTPVESLPPAQSSEELSACINEKEGEAGGASYSGFIISFIDNISREDSRKILDEYHEVSITREFNTANMYSVSVPQGKEFEYMCKLEKYDNVKSVQLNSADPYN